MLEDGSVWNYQYDDRGEVTSGKRYWAGQTPVGGQQFVYDYDNIGNRKTTGRGGDGAGNGLRTETYTANALNQYTAVSLSNLVDVVGVAYANVNANVSLNGGSATAATRQGEYFFTAAALGSSSASTSNEVSVVSSAGGTTNKGAIYRPPLAQSLSYDLDGNLVSDGLWKYAWDSENRLAVMFMTNLTAGPRFQLEFQYDYQGRRVRKTVKARSIDSNAWVVSADVQFVYEGWNLMAELDVLSNKNVVRSYVWGLDLSGTPQKAGGIGGALGMRTGTAGTAQIYCYDGNGNVVGQVDSSSIAWSAQYEYGPFGEGIRSTGTGAKTNPLRFSTKYQDEESELIYYGYRFYNASSGRWISRDPIGERGGVNLYGFVMNKAISCIDVLGLLTDSDFDAHRFDHLASCKQTLVYSFNPRSEYDFLDYALNFWSWGGQFVDNGADVIADLQARFRDFDPDGRCCKGSCIKSITLTKHGSGAGTLDFGPGYDYNQAKIGYDGVDLASIQNARRREQAEWMQNALRLLRAIKGKLCRSSDIYFVMCGAGGEEEGNQLNLQLQSLFGPNANIHVYSGDAAVWLGHGTPVNGRPNP